MLVFSLEYYSRIATVIILGADCDLSGESDVIETITLMRMYLFGYKFVSRMRYWNQRKRMGLEFKTSYVVGSASYQRKLGFYTVARYVVWLWIRCVSGVCRRKMRVKHRCVWTTHNIRATLDNNRRLEVKFHEDAI